MSRNRSNAVTLAALAALAVLGCGGDNLGTEKPVAAVSVTPTTSTITPGGTVQLQAATKDADGATVTGREISWSSSDNAIATVSATGLVTGVADGSATITATSEGQSGSAVIAVATPTTLNSAAVSVGVTNSCGTTAAGAAYCWGGNAYGELGIGTTTGPESCPLSHDVSVPCSTIPVPVAGGVSFASVSVGASRSCGITAAGAAYCWVSNGYGELGIGTTDPESSTIPVPVAGGLSFASVSAAAYHTCGITVAGAAYCWGKNQFGGLGDGTTDARSTPVPVVGGLNFASLSAGEHYTRGVTVAEATYCWGINFFGQLGNGNLEPQLMPVSVAGHLSFVSVSAAQTHTCGITTAGTAYCWGFNENGQLGDGTTTQRLTPTLVANQ